MIRIGKLLTAACVIVALASSPALAQQGGQGGMMGKGGPGQGMMDKGGPGQSMMGHGMMSQSGQPDSQGMKCPMMGKSMMNKSMGKGHDMMHSRPMMEAHLAYVKADLEITDAQEDAWNGYADAVRAGFTAMEGPREAMMKAKDSGNAPERMDARIKATETKLDDLKTLKPKVDALYDVLTDDQKAKADKVLGGGCGMK